MKVALDISYTLRGYSGTATYIEMLHRGLQAAGVDVVTFADKSRSAPAGGGIGSLNNLRRDLWWTNVELPRLAANADADVLHHPLPAYSGLNIATRAARRLGKARRSSERLSQLAIAQVCTVHDLGFVAMPKLYDPSYARWAAASHRRACGAADALIAVSKSTRTELKELWQIPEDKIVVAHHGPGQQLEATSAETADFALAGEYVLYVGDSEPRKDLKTLLTGFKLLKEQLTSRTPALVLAGNSLAVVAQNLSDDQYVLVRGPLKGKLRGGSVYLIEKPTSSQLGQLLGKSTALVHPALHEGFGLTPLEAMQQGTPVVAAASVGVSEICGNAAKYFEPANPEALARALGDLLVDAKTRGELVQFGYLQADQYSWELSTAQHLAAYNQAQARRNG